MVAERGGSHGGLAPGRLQVSHGLAGHAADAHKKLKMEHWSGRGPAKGSTRRAVSSQEALEASLSLAARDGGCVCVFVVVVCCCCVLPFVLLLLIACSLRTFGARVLSVLFACALCVCLHVCFCVCILPFISRYVPLRDVRDEGSAVASVNRFMTVGVFDSLVRGTIQALLF